MTMVKSGSARVVMRKRCCAGLLVGVFSVHSPCWAADAGTPDFTGRWNVVVRYGADTASMVLELKQSAGKYTGSSTSPETGFGLTYDGSIKSRRLSLIPSAEGFAKLMAAPKIVGKLDLRIEDERLVGNGTLYNVPVTLSGERPDEGPRAPMTHDYVPTRYITYLSARNEPVLHIRAGDSVRTTTVDALGLDENRQWASVPGNAHTGPFHVAGAMPGDTLVVHLTRVRVNQPRAEMLCGGLSTNALPANVAPQWDAECNWIWTLDAENNVARPDAPSSRLKNFRVPLRPMVGSIGVAPPHNEAISAADLRFHGGNLDYNRIVEGTTLYFPVFHAGALFSLGDGHAAQGDGELTGQGLETSLSVEFKVDLIKGKAPRFPWAEDAEYIMFSGIGNSMDAALQAATAGMVDWLKDRYQLSTGDIAMILGTSIQYDVAEVVDARPHIVAKLRKDSLAQIQPQ